MIPPQQSPELSGSPEDWLPVVYEELRRLARDQMRQEATPQTLQTTELVHEAYLRLIGSGATDWSNRGHFFGAAARAMRRILVDRARARKADKRGGGNARLPMDLVDVDRIDQHPGQLLALDLALEKLERRDERKARIVMLRFFGGLTIEDTAAALDISKTTVKDEWNFARAWLYQEINAK